MKKLLGVLVVSGMFLFLFCGGALALTLDGKTYTEITTWDGMGFSTENEDGEVELVPCLINCVRDFGNLSFQIDDAVRQPRLKVQYD